MKFKLQRRESQKMCSLILSGVMLASVMMSCSKSNQKPAETTVVTEETIVTEEATTIDLLEVASLDELGVELEFPKKEEKNEYKNPSGDVEIEEIYEDTNGTVWVNEEAASRIDEIGKEVIDDKDDSLEVKTDGSVYEKETGYQIIDDSGDVVESGTLDSDGAPEGYEWDADRNEYVEEEELGDYIYSDKDFYFEDGTLAIAKGDLVSKETYERAQRELLTTKPVVSTTTKPAETIYVPETKAPETTNIEIVAPKVETTVKSEITTTVQETTSVVTTAPQTTIPSAPDEFGGIENPDGTYTIYGTTYMDKATFQAFILDENSENFGYLDGIIYPKSILDEMNKQNTLVK